MSRAGDIGCHPKKIQQSTNAFEFAEGLYGNAGMHSLLDLKEHGPYNFTILQ